MIHFRIYLYSILYFMNHNYQNETKGIEDFLKAL